LELISSLKENLDYDSFVLENLLSLLKSTNFGQKKLIPIFDTKFCKERYLKFGGFFLLVGVIDPQYPFMSNATEAPLMASSYDYIVVGGGTAGCPLAATLSENFTVLLLERGGESTKLSFFFKQSFGAITCRLVVT
jgi:hypothetical protein